MKTRINKQAKELRDILLSSHHVRILSHRNPDGDSIGSVLAFKEICNFFECSFDIVTVDPIPKNLSFLIKDTPLLFFDSDNLLELQNEHTDLVVFLDCGQINRSGLVCEQILSHQKIINIDHHLSNPMFGDFNCVHDISSTCELLFQIITVLEIPLSQQLAEYLYVGVVTDTGCFQYDKVTTDTHYMIATLLEYSIQPAQIYKQIYQNNSLSWIKVLQAGLDHLELYHSNSLAIVSLSRLNLLHVEQEYDNTHILFPIILTIDCIKICILVKEKEDGSISASLRSKEDTIDVAKIAQEFGGGGHKKSAGCRSSNYSLSEFKELLYQAVSEYL